MLESGILEVYPGQVTTLHWHKAEEERVENAKIFSSIFNRHIQYISGFENFLLSDFRFFSFPMSNPGIFQGLECISAPLNSTILFFRAKEFSPWEIKSLLWAFKNDLCLNFVHC